ncbi:hypothetical protein AB1Y20_011675 [Prymnesium parvum]|uniref:Cation efflux protein transmembrane domain-containing protein n=1 Tax=Prymnesium parvum TaxID=97485 RepID=A0AB34IK33_PRYPA
MACTVLAFVVGLVISVISKSSATLGYALENAVDSFSSALVLWRFWGGGATVPESILQLREKRASVGIALAFVALALVVGGTAIAHLSKEEELSHHAELIALSLPSVFIFTLLGLLKLHIGRATDSPSMRKDGACSLCGGVLSLGVCIGASASLSDSSLFWIDASVAVAVSAGLLLYGLFILNKNAQQNNRWWSVGFWMHGPSRNGSSSPQRAEFSPSLEEFSPTIAGEREARLPPQAV